MKYYPIFGDIRDKICVIVGGSEVVARKAERLLDCGAKVLVIGPQLTPALAALKEKGVIYHIGAEYTDDLIHGAVLVMILGAFHQSFLKRMVRLLVGLGTD